MNEISHLVNAIANFEIVTIVGSFVDKEGPIQQSLIDILF